ncbi:MAG: hypothetical protein J6Y20_10180 [Lachnospiraceae bacterium]|nr:hypothetical protein [Lachnospiraceae bacterium]
MSDPTPTRQDTVEDNIDAVVEKYGDEAFKKMVVTCLKDISVSLAMLVDNSGTNSGT